MTPKAAWLEPWESAHSRPSHCQYWTQYVSTKAHLCFLTPPESMSYTFQLDNHCYNTTHPGIWTFNILKLAQDDLRGRRMVGGSRKWKITVGKPWLRAAFFKVMLLGVVITDQHRKGDFSSSGLLRAFRRLMCFVRHHEHIYHVGLPKCIGHRTFLLRGFTGPGVCIVHLGNELQDSQLDLPGEF